MAVWTKGRGLNQEMGPTRVPFSAFKLGLKKDIPIFAMIVNVRSSQNRACDLDCVTISINTLRKTKKGTLAQNSFSHQK